MAQEKKIPKHIAIIMDGNGRWAKKRGLPRTAGHLAGIRAIKRIIKACVELEVKVLSIYAFSTENWSRPKQEVNMLMDALVKFLDKEVKELMENDIRLVVSGEITNLSRKVQQALVEAINKTKKGKRFIINLCLNYGGRTEILRAVKQISSEVADKKINLNQIDEGLFEQYLYTSGLPEPELLIRTSGEQRISNYLLWQLSYAEFYFTKTLWPNFNKKHLVEAIDEFQRRHRRFGGL